MTNFLVTVKDVTVFTISDSLQILDTNAVFTHVQTLVRNNTIITPLTTILHTMIVSDPAMTNIIQNLVQDYIILFAQTTIQQPPVARKNLTLVLANALLVITTPVLDAINHQLVLLFNHIMTTTAVALTLFWIHTQIINTNPPTQQPSLITHHPLSTEPTFKVIMYHPNTSSGSQSSTPSNSYANAITP